MSTPPFPAIVVCLALSTFAGPGCGCSGDDSAHRRATVPAGDGAPVAAGADAGAAVGSAAPTTAPLTEDMATPYFASGEAGTAAGRFALEDFTAARAGFAAALAALPASADAATRARLELMIALCDAAQSAWPAAADGFERAVAGLPLLADYIGYQAARARYFAHDRERALAIARAVAADSISGADAELLIGDLLRGGGDPVATAATYRAYLAARPDGIRLSEARFRLAEALELQGVAGDEVLLLYRTITIADPLASWATLSQARLDALLPALPAAERDRYTTLTADELIERGTVYFDAMRNPLSEADFAAALLAPGATDENRCIAEYHHAQSFFKARNRTDAAPAFDRATALCRTAGNTDLQIKSGYQAGRSYAYLAQHETAAARYADAEVVDPNHSFADDARLREAEEWASLADDAKVRATLGTLPATYPTGDMRAEAMWRLAWRAYRAGDLEEATDWLNKQIETVPLDDNYWAEGQPQYWLGRTWQRRAAAATDAGARRDGEAAALDAYVAAVRQYPMSYYAMLALNRLRESAPGRYQDLLSEIRTAPADEDPATPTFSFRPRAEYATPGFARAVELLKLGLGDAAEAELTKLGLTLPEGKQRVEDPDTIEKLWAMAFLYDRAGRYGTSHWMTRWHILDYKRRWPVGKNAARWRIAYPPAYLDILERWAGKRAVPVQMLQAIVREESAFDPLRESYANAIGLTQMIPSTGARFAKGTGLTADRDTLRDPEKNVTIGSNFLGFLFRKWNDFAMLVPPSYNAGEGAVTRMLKLRGDWPADEFIEAIVDDQARNYSKRVLASYFVYGYLKDGSIPVMPNDIPSALRPGKKQGEQVVEPVK